MALLGIEQQWHDATGTGVLTTHYWQQDETTAIADALAAMSHAYTLSVQATTLLGGYDAGGPGDIAVQTAARLLYQDENGNRVPVIVPSVDPSIFLADGETVDPTNALVAALSNALFAHGASGAGTTIVAYVSGARIVLRTPPITH